MKKLISSIALAMVASPVLAVDATPFFSVYGGAGSWSTEVSGSLGDSNTDVSDLGLSDESNAYFYVAFEHSVPVIPNVRLERSSISSSGNETVSGDFVFGGQTYDGDANIQTDIDIAMTDAVLYYEIAMFDFGLTVRHFDAEATVRGTPEGSGNNLINPAQKPLRVAGTIITGPNETTTSETVDGYLPMLYLQTKIDLPFTGLYVTGNVNGISIDGKSVTDYRAAVGYGIELSILAEIGLELGYRGFEIDLGDDEDFAGDIEFSGVYFGANVKF